MDAAVAELPAVARTTPSPAHTVDRIAAPDPAAFRRDYLLPRKPVVVTGIVDRWLAQGDYSPARFRRDYGDMRVLPVAGVQPTIREVLDAIESNDPQRRAPYPARIDLDRMAPALRDEFVPRYAGSLPDRLGHPLLPTRLFAGYSNWELFFGGRKAKFPYLHYDYFHVHTWVNQLYGRKTFVLYPPDDAACLYPRADEPWQSSIADIDAPDLARFPRFALARPHVVTLAAGDALFMPTGWWHTTRADEPNISVAFGQLGDDNWDEFVDDACAIVRQRRFGGLLEPLARVYFAAVGAASRIAERRAVARI